MVIGVVFLIVICIGLIWKMNGPIDDGSDTGMYL
jgi:hypothetical protein